MIEITTELNLINQANAETPGKIAAVYDWVAKTEYFIHSMDDFNPEIQDLLITQIWTPEQDELVQAKIKSIVQSITQINNTDVLELIRLYEMRTEWLENHYDYTITTSD